MKGDTTSPLLVDNVKICRGMIPQEQIPHIMKYMGGKREMLEDIHRVIDQMDVRTSSFCDLFSGTAIVSYSMSDRFNVVSNDIQTYSSVLAKTYFNDYSRFNPYTISDSIFKESNTIVQSVKDRFPELSFTYREEMSYEEMQDIEKAQMSLIDQDFRMGFSLFKRCYSGTYWSYEQCLWIDAIRAVAERYYGDILYYPVLSSLIFALSYSTQSTGHFAQFRSLSQQNYKSILLYRTKSIPDLFRRKLIEILSLFRQPVPHSFRTSSLDFKDCILTLPERSLVYADPPYSAVHYSRFYHVLETLVRYDNPRLEYKGRYREDRYQSPFDQKGNVAKAFEDLFNSISDKQCDLVLSYSDNGLLSENELDSIAHNCLEANYSHTTHIKDYHHMTMGRLDEAHHPVHELLKVYQRN